MVALVRPIAIRVTRLSSSIPAVPSDSRRRLRRCVTTPRHAQAAAGHALAAIDSVEGKASSQWTCRQLASYKLRNDMPAAAYAMGVAKMANFPVITIPPPCGGGLGWEVMQGTGPPAKSGMKRVASPLKG